MTLTIIAGTHSFIDLTGKFTQAILKSTKSLTSYNIDGVRFKKHRFDRVTITKEGWVIKDPMRILPIGSSGMYWTVSQPTGSLKTALAVEVMRRTVARGGNIQANFSFKWMKHNIGKPKEQWTPSITSIEDITKASHTRLTIDDIKGTIDHWQAKEADIISMAANLGRKESVDIDITSQGVTNYVPPNIRRIATGYMIPYCTIRDKRLYSPDGKGFPRECEIISLIPGDTNVGDVFVGFGFINGDIPNGELFIPTQELFDSYMTMEHAKGLKVGGVDSKRPGLEGEQKLLAYLQLHYPDITFHLKNGKGVFDIESPHALLDHVGIEEHGTGYRLNTRHKNISKHRDYSQLHKTPAYIVYEWNGDYRFLTINSPYTLDVNPMINTGMLKASRSRIAVFG